MYYVYKITTEQQPTQRNLDKIWDPLTRPAGESIPENCGLGFESEVSNGNLGMINYDHKENSDTSKFLVIKYGAIPNQNSPGLVIQGYN